MSSKNIEAYVSKSRLHGTLQHECEHMDFGACARCRGQVPFLSGETDKALEPLGLIEVGTTGPIHLRYPR